MTLRGVDMSDSSRLAVLAHNSRRLSVHLACAARSRRAVRKETVRPSIRSSAMRQQEVVYLIHGTCLKKLVTED